MKLSIQAFGVDFQNPVLLAAGTCGFGMEVVDVLDIEALGGFVTKSITLEARLGNPAPRVAEFESGMINSVGLANPARTRFATPRRRYQHLVRNMLRVACSREPLFSSSQGVVFDQPLVRQVCASFARRP